MKLPVIILAGGAGERIRDIANNKPKVMLKIAGKPIVEYVIENIINIGLNNVYIVTDKPNYFEDLSIKYGKIARIDIIKQEVPEIRGAVLTAKDVISQEYFMLVYGDILAPKQFYSDVVDAFNVYSKPVMALVPEEDVTSYGAAIVDSKGIVRKVVEKPKEVLPGAYAIGGLYILNKDFFDVLEKSEDMGEALSEYSSKRSIIASIWSGWWIDVGYPWDLLKAVYFVLKGLNRTIISPKADVASSAIIKGPVVVEDDAVIDEYSVIKGPVYIGKGVYVGNYALIREYVDLERNVIVASNVEVVWSCIQDKVTIGRNSYLGFSVVGEKAVIEPNVTTLTLLKSIKEKPIIVKRRGQEYAKLGAFIGANSRVRVGTILEAGTLVKKKTIYGKS